MMPTRLAPDPSPSSPLRRVLGVALLFATALVGVVAGSEVVLSLVRADTIRPYRLSLQDPNIEGENYLRYGDTTPFRVRRNYSGSFGDGKLIHTGPRGMRFDGHPIGETANILALGDSFTFGYLLGDDQTYPAALQTILDDKRPGWLVANGGYAGGFSFDGAYVRYRDDLWTLNPELVIYGVFENDYSDFADEIWAEVDADGYPVRIRGVRDMLVEEAYRYPLLRELRLFVGLSMQWQRWKRRDVLGDGSIDWGRVETVIRGFAASTRSHGARLVFVFFDEPYNGYADTLAARSHRSVADVRAEIATSNAKLRAILDRNGVRWLDDTHLIGRARATLKRGQKLELMRCFAPKRAAMLAAVRGSEPDDVLAAEDGMHYSWFANVLLSQWLYQKLLADAAPVAKQP